jgi:uncharacterized spore protein YtfJ
LGKGGRLSRWQTTEQFLSSLLNLQHAYLEAVEDGKASAAQEGFDAGYAAGARLGSVLGQLRGLMKALAHYETARMSGGADQDAQRQLSSLILGFAPAEAAMCRTVLQLRDLDESNDDETKTIMASHGVPWSSLGAGEAEEAKAMEPIAARQIGASAGAGKGSCCGDDSVEGCCGGADGGGSKGRKGCGCGEEGGSTVSPVNPLVLSPSKATNTTIESKHRQVMVALLPREALAAISRCCSLVSKTIQSSQHDHHHHTLAPMATRITTKLEALLKELGYDADASMEGEKAEVAAPATAPPRTGPSSSSSSSVVVSPRTRNRGLIEIGGGNSGNSGLTIAASLSSNGGTVRSTPLLSPKELAAVADGGAGASSSW